MKVKIIFGMLSMLAVSNSFASAGTVHFTGTIQAAGCDVTPTTKNQIVDFGIISGKEFVATGDTAAAKSFHIDLTACPRSVAPNDKVALRFSGVQDPDNNNLLSVGTGSSYAKKVGIAIFNQADNSAVQMFQNTSPAAIVYPSGTTGTGDVSIHLVAKLQSTGTAVTPGKIDSTADFSIIYQ